MSDSPRIIICGAGAIGASVAYFLTQRGIHPTIVERAEPGAAASGKSGGFLALDWNDETPLRDLTRASFALHREIAEDLGASTIGYRPMETLSVAASMEGDLERYRRHPSPDWLDGNAVVHDVIGTQETTAQIDPAHFTRGLVDAAVARGATYVTGIVDGVDRDPESGAVRGVSVDGEIRPADVVVLALGPWTDRAARWLALPQVVAMKSASITLQADLPAQAVFTEFLDTDGTFRQPEIYPRPGGIVYVNGYGEPDPLPDDPRAIYPSAIATDALHRMAGAQASVLADAEVIDRRSCFRPVTIDGIPFIGPVDGAEGVILAAGHASWGMLLAPATGRMVTEMILDGESHSVDATPFLPSRHPAARM